MEGSLSVQLASAAKVKIFREYMVLMLFFKLVGTGKCWDLKDTDQWGRVSTVGEGSGTGWFLWEPPGVFPPCPCSLDLQRVGAGKLWG